MTRKKQTPAAKLQADVRDVQARLNELEKQAYALGTIAGTVRPTISQAAVALRSAPFSVELGKLG